ncbi:DUF3667 domain-containing protein [Pedobacter sp. Leaf250]|uniref:DUF3667 domain-containing protein n=1 Tax=Pedobacter sp. Leaf250 TaxID=2876559 RepID=UPI001E2D5845|nr:DUF3667 domain-containing protein [Pedobacter sp. Leaf250]
MVEETVKPTDLTLDQVKPEINLTSTHHHESNGCLNCAKPIAEKFCPNCGQKSTTHRYSIAHFVEHDFIHGVWHVDKGLLFTVKELFTRPGHSIREYIQGRRASHFSFVTLILLILTASTLLAPYLHIKMSDLIPMRTKNVMNSFEEFVTKYPKIFIVILIPFNSIFSFLWFRKARFNFSEHLVANSYKAAAELIIGLLFTVLMIFYTNLKILTIVYFSVIMPIVFFYGIWFYYQLFTNCGYSKKALFFRSFGVILSIAIFQAIFGFLWGMFQMMSMK